MSAAAGDAPRQAVRVLEGIRVVEVSHFAYVPAAGAALADWGANVIKVENPASGDPMRGVTIGGIPPGTGGFTFMWELANRGKRSIGIDIATDAGRDVLLHLVRDADVFLTSFLPGVRAKLRITEADIRSVNPRIVYASGSGQGARGPEVDAGGFDQTSFWYRAGVASSLTPPGGRPPDMPGAGFGDVTSGLTLAGGIAAALVHVQRTGEGIAVDGSLLATGMWAMQASIVVTGILGIDEFRFLDRLETTNPLVNTYRTKDDRFIGLCVIKADKHWTELCEALGRPDLVDDPRFRDQDVRAENAAACVQLLDEIFLERSLDDWTAVLTTQGAQWSVVQRANELRRDQQVAANGYLQEVDYGNGRRLELVPAPVQHGGAPPELRAAPELGADTEAVLLEAGMNWEEISRLKAAGAIS
jgi:crotonobetainyl-CoA:carnitine CoA-transferase CaiB-like acyl-CoA transferase